MRLRRDVKYVHDVDTVWYIWRKSVVFKCRSTSCLNGGEVVGC